MASDRDLVSKEDHEINYLLQKWEKKQSKSNREIVVEELSKFKKDDDYKPHNRENFYKYIEDNKIKAKLEASDKKEDNKSNVKIDKAEKKQEIKKKETDKKIKASVKKQTKSGEKIKIKLIKSPFGYKKDQIGTIRALGLRKMNQIKEHTDNPILRGMIFKVKHLVEVVK